MNISIWALGLVVGLIAVRKVGPFSIKIWQAMAGRAAMVLLTGQISVGDAIKAINLQVMAFLFGMFIIGQALVSSGYLYYLGYQLFGRFKSVNGLLIGVLFIAALGSALLMNDTLAIIGTPLVLRLAREHRLNSHLLLLTLAYAITIGSIMSPIGNPQNFLIAVQGHLPSPFQTFFAALAIPTVINLLLTYLVLRVAYRHQFAHSMPLCHNPVKVPDRREARLARASLALLLGFIVINLVLASIPSSSSIELSHIALLAALPPLLFSANRWQLLKGLDWSTLLFFAALFILMASVWQTGIAQQQIAELGINLSTVPTILLISTVFSQIISNVPLVALYLPLLESKTPELLMSLAAGSTIAGNFLILGAASNVIIIQQAEKHSVTLSLVEFARVGFPLGLINLMIYGLWLYYWYHVY